MPTPAGPRQTLSMSVEEDTSSSDEEGGDVQFNVAPGSLAQARSLEQKGRYVEAVQVYGQVIQKDPGNANAWWSLGNCYVKLARKNYALQCFEHVIKLKPEATALKEWVDQYRDHPMTDPPQP